MMLLHTPAPTEFIGTGRPFRRRRLHCPGPVTTAVDALPAPELLNQP